MKNQVNEMVKELKKINYEYYDTLYSALEDAKKAQMADAAEAHEKGELEAEMRCKAYGEGISLCMHMMAYALTSYRGRTADLYAAIGEACNVADDEEAYDEQ